MLPNDGQKAPEYTWLKPGEELNSEDAAPRCLIGDGKPGRSQDSLGVCRSTHLEDPFEGNERLFHATFDRAPIGMAIVDLTGRLTRTNVALQEMLRYSGEELSGMLFTDITFPDDVRADWQLARELFAGKGDTYQIVKRYTRKDNTLMWGRLTASLVRDDKGNPIFGIGMLADVTELKQAEASLRESEAKFRDLIETLPAAVFETDEDGKLTYANQKAFEEFGYSKQDFDHGLNICQTITPKDRQRAMHNAGRILKGEVLGLSEYEALRKDGTTLHAMFHSLPIIKNDKIVGLRGYVADVTELRQADEELRANAERHSKILETAMDGFLTLNSEGRLEEVNETYCRMSGYSKEELLNMSIHDLDTRESFSEMHTHLQRIIKEGQDRFESEHRRKDGSIFQVEVSVKYHATHGGILMVFLRDVTESKRLETLIRGTQRMEAIGTLAGGIAHDFNNILTPVIIQAELALLNVTDDGFMKRNLQEVLEAGYRAKNLVKQILAFSRQTETERVPLLVAPIMKEVLRLLRSTLPTTVTIEKKIERETHTVLADPTQIHQVLMNLCTNAAHALRTKGGLLKVGLEETLIGPNETRQNQTIDPGTYLKLTVSDTGHGIEPCIKERIFEPFFTTKDRTEGTGMGLSVVHGIVKSHGGTISVESELGRGTTFAILLPSTRKNTASVSVQRGELPGGNEQILVVDDEIAMVKALKAMLTQLGYTVVSNTSSIEALNEVKAAPDHYDLVITDQTMPNMTGVELARALLQVRKDLPIVLCTGFSDLVDEKKAKQEGIKQYVLKPIIMKEMAAAVRAALDD